MQGARTNIGGTKDQVSYTTVFRCTKRFWVLLGEPQQQFCSDPKLQLSQNAKVRYIDDIWKELLVLERILVV